jgi:hypothetical protein
MGAADRDVRAVVRAATLYATKDDLEGVRLQIDGRPSDGGDVVTMPQLVRVAGNFQNAVKTATREIDALKEVIPNLVMKRDLDGFLEAVQKALESQEGREVEATAAGRVAYKCLLCGRATGAVTGMITDSQVAQMVGEPPVSGPAAAAGEFVLVYGREGCFRAASAAKKKRPVRALPKIGSG